MKGAKFDFHISPSQSHLNPVFVQPRSTTRDIEQRQRRDDRSEKTGTSARRSSEMDGERAEMLLNDPQRAPERAQGGHGV